MQKNIPPKSASDNLRSKGESLYELERSLAANQSEAIITAYLNANQIQVEFDLQNQKFETSHALLRNSEGRILARGAGKGKMHSLGAVAEAVEHLIFYDSATLDQNEITIGRICDQEPFASDHFIQHLKSTYESESLRCGRFTCLKTSKQHWTPTGYVNPNTFKVQDSPFSGAELQLSKFSTNTGGALGLTLEDSLVHGLNECIERHYESLLCQEFIGIDTGVDWRIISESSTEEFRLKRQVVEQVYGDVIVISAKTMTESYVCFAILADNSNFVLAHIGAGSSRFPNLASQRAIDELAQCLCLTENVISEDVGAVNEEYRSRETLESYKGFAPLVNLDGSRVARFARKEAVWGHTPHASLSVQLATLVDGLLLNKHVPIYRILSSADNVFVTQVFVPSLDKFFVVRSGHLVAPLRNYKPKAVASA